MSSSAGILSQTLQSITNTKISELRQQRDTFAALKTRLLASVDNVAEPEVRIRLLLAEIAGCAPESGKKLEDFEDRDLNGDTGELSLKNIRRFLDQSRYDASVPESLLKEWEQELRLLLDQRSHRLDYADLYARLLTEWLADTSAATTPPPEASIGDKGQSSEEPFELVAQTRLQQLWEMFESCAFTPLETDTLAITSHLDGLFESDDAAKALRSLRDEVKSISNNLLASSSPFNVFVLTWCIKGLLKNDLTEHKKTLLEEFLHNKVVLMEIADVLNMRFANLGKWSWGEDGICVEPWKQLNGKYRVMMDEDILQAIFLHYIGLTWAVKMKSALRRVVQHPKVWKKSTAPLSRAETRRPEYFLGTSQYSSSTQGKAFAKQTTWETDYFLAQLPDTVEAGAQDGYDDVDDDKPKRNIKTPLNIRQQLLH